MEQRPDPSGQGAALLLEMLVVSVVFKLIGVVPETHPKDASVSI